jgi:hypothetical protein
VHPALSTELLKTFQSIAVRSIRHRSLQLPSLPWREFFRERAEHLLAQKIDQEINIERGAI